MNLLCQLLGDATFILAADIAVGTTLLYLPPLIAHASQWAFSFASRQADGKTVSHLV